jgi:hypothetical protein
VESQAQQARQVSQVRPGLQDLRALTVLQGLQVLQVRRATLELSVLLAQPAPPAPQGLLARLALVVRPGQLVLLARQVPHSAYSRHIRPRHQIPIREMARFSSTTQLPLPLPQHISTTSIRTAGQYLD